GAVGPDGYAAANSISYLRDRAVRVPLGTNRAFAPQDRSSCAHGAKSFEFGDPLVVGLGGLANRVFGQSMRGAVYTAAYIVNNQPDTFARAPCPSPLGWSRRSRHSPRAARTKVRPPSPPSAQSVQTKKKPPVDLAISP